jgi:hypothetical protein
MIDQELKARLDLIPGLGSEQLLCVGVVAERSLFKSEEGFYHGGSSSLFSVMSHPQTIDLVPCFEPDGKVVYVPPLEALASAFINLVRDHWREIATFGLIAWPVFLMFDYGDGPVDPVELSSPRDNGNRSDQNEVVALW